MLELARVQDAMWSTELIYCFDPDGPQDRRGSARPDHCDHIHIGWDRDVVSPHRSPGRRG